MPYYYFYGYDPTYFFVFIVTLIISAYAQIKVKTTFKKYSAICNVKRVSGAMAAQQVAQFGGAGYVGIQKIEGVFSERSGVYRRAPLG